MIKRYVQGKFVPSYKPTIGADFFTNEMIITNEEQKVTVQYWDTTGQERYRSLAQSYYKGANCCVLVYDITSSSSFKHLSEWKDRFLLTCSGSKAETFPFVVIGNKLDLHADRKVSTEEAESWCQQDQVLIPFYEASALLGGLEEVFQNVADIAWANYIEDLDVIKIGKKKQSRKLGKSINKCNC